MHVTANTEELGHEAMARIFYLSNRYTRDLIGARPRAARRQIDNVVGLTWPLATFCAEAEVPYFFHGPNGYGHCFGPAAAEPVFYLARAFAREAGCWCGRCTYGGYDPAADAPGKLSEARVTP